MVKVTKKFCIELELDMDNFEKLSQDMDILAREHEINSVTRDLADVIRASLYA